MKQQKAPVQTRIRTKAEPQSEADPKNLVSDIDELLDEIDSVLEEQEILTSYRQRSGQ